MFGDRPLPWVDSWAHLGNDLDRTDLCLQRKSSLYKDANQKRMKFIGKFYSLRQEFGFCDHDIFFNILNIYATSFYGSNLWLFSGPSCERLFKSWNIMIRNVWNLPNTTHKYFIEQISESPHLKTILCQRFLTFIQSLLNSKKKCLSQLARKMVMDQGSISGKNLNFVSTHSGYPSYSILKMSPRAVLSELKFYPVPEDSAWKVNLLKELISLRDCDDVHIESQTGQEFLTKEEIQDLIALVSTN